MHFSRVPFAFVALSLVMLGEIATAVPVDSPSAAAVSLQNWGCSAVVDGVYLVGPVRLWGTSMLQVHLHRAGLKDQSPPWFAWHSRREPRRPHWSHLCPHQGELTPSRGR